MSTNAERFGRLVRERREELDLNQLELQAAGGPSNSTLTRIENGLLESLARTTARKLDKGLQWVPGSAKRAYEGGDPMPTNDYGLNLSELDALATIIGAADLDTALKAKLLKVLEDEGKTA